MSFWPRTSIRTPGTVRPSLEVKADDPLVLSAIARLLRDSDPDRAFMFSSKAMQLQSDRLYL